MTKDEQQAALQALSDALQAYRIEIENTKKTKLWRFLAFKDRVICAVIRFLDALQGGRTGGVWTDDTMGESKEESLCEEILTRCKSGLVTFEGLHE